MTSIEIIRGVVVRSLPMAALLIVSVFAFTIREKQHDIGQAIIQQKVGLYKYGHFEAKRIEESSYLMAEILIMSIAFVFATFFVMKNKRTWALMTVEIFFWATLLLVGFCLCWVFKEDFFSI